MRGRRRRATDRIALCPACMGDGHDGTDYMSQGPRTCRACGGTGLATPRKLYVWRSSWDGMWHVSRDPKPETPYAAHMRRNHGKRFWTHRQAFADAWARTHPKED